MVTGKCPPFSRRGEQAIAAFQDAAWAAMTRTEVGDDIVYGAEAMMDVYQADASHY